MTEGSIVKTSPWNSRVMKQLCDKCNKRDAEFGAHLLNENRELNSFSLCEPCYRNFAEKVREGRFQPSQAKITKKPAPLEKSVVTTIGSSGSIFK